MSVSLKIDSKNHGLRVDRCIRDGFAGAPQSLIEKLARKGQILLNGQRVKPSDRVSLGQTLDIKYKLEKKELDPSHKIPPAHLLEKLNASIVFEDADVLVLNKPSDLCSQGGTQVTHSVDSALRYMGMQKNVEYKLTHRIDRYTTGILVVAKGRNAAATITQAFRERTIKKNYVALVWGQPPRNKSRIESVINPRGTGPAAITTYDSIVTSELGFSLVRLHPLTGHKHQLRIHLSQLGSPIIGDDKYGDFALNKKVLGDQVFLHAHSIVLPGYQPIVAPFPEHFKAFLDKFNMSDVLNAI